MNDGLTFPARDAYLIVATLCIGAMAGLIYADALMPPRATFVLIVVSAVGLAPLSWAPLVSLGGLLFLGLRMERHPLGVLPLSETGLSDGVVLIAGLAAAYLSAFFRRLVAMQRERLASVPIKVSLTELLWQSAPCLIYPLPAILFLGLAPTGWQWSEYFDVRFNVMHLIGTIWLFGAAALFARVASTYIGCRTMSADEAELVLNTLIEDDLRADLHRVGRGLAKHP